MAATSMELLPPTTSFNPKLELYINYCDQSARLIAIAELRFSKTIELPLLTQEDFALFLEDARTIDHLVKEPLKHNESTYTYLTPERKFTIQWSECTIANTSCNHFRPGIDLVTSELMMAKIVMVERDGKFTLQNEYENVRWLNPGNNIKSVVKCYLIWRNWLIMPLYTKGDLWSCAEKVNGFPLLKVVKIIMSVVEVLLRCNEKNMVHKDWKSENILVEENDEIAVADWEGKNQWDGKKPEELSVEELQQIYIEGPYTPQSYPYWDISIRGMLLSQIRHADPSLKERLVQELRRCTVQSDVFSIACMFLPLHRRKKLFKNDPQEHLIYSTKYFKKLDKLNMPKLKNLIVEMLAYDYNERPSPEQVYDRISKIKKDLEK